MVINMKIVLAYSGGLDTSAILALLASNGHEVVTVTVDVGQKDDLKGAEERAYHLGASKHIHINAVEEFAEQYISWAVKANALYEEQYPLGTALARPLIAMKVAKTALGYGADAVAHGCTSKGNDQVRFDAMLKYYLGDNIEIIAPVRELGLTREKSLKILKEAGLSLGTPHKKYSIDENLWSRSIEGGELDDLGVEPPEEVYAWTISPEKAPDEPLYLEIGFDKGIPYMVDGVEMPLHVLVKYLNEVVGGHGYGRIDHVENRVVGLKSREIYEAPAALALIHAHKDLEKTVYTPKEYRFKQLVDREWTDLVYQGLWMEPLKKHLESYIDSSNKYVSGTVTLKVYKGSITIVSRKPEYTSYSMELIDYNKGWYPSAEEATGFIMIYTMHSLYTAWARKQAKKASIEEKVQAS